MRLSTAGPRRAWCRVFVVVVLGALPAGRLMAAEEGPLAGCAAIAADAERLACYDRLAGRAPPPSATPAAQSPPPAQPSRLSARWELEAADKRGIFNFRAHRPTYILPAHYTDSINSRPTSPAPDHTVVLPRDYDHTEAKFQISFKTKLLENLSGGSDLWFGYTQQSLWQVYNRQQSAPFRETDYEPELYLTLPTDYSLLGLRGRLLGFGLAHHSNGQSVPRSRSWNRAFLQLGFERGDFALLVKPWWRIPESATTDDNPDIADYIGRMEVLALLRRGEQNFTFTARHNLQRASGRGSLRLDWSFPLAGQLRGYFELFSGFGESLIDYNHRQHTVGLGIALLDWW